MAYCADLFKHRSSGRWYDRDKDILMLSIGWLDEHHAYTRGDTPREFRDRLRRFCIDPPGTTVSCGYHPCPFCGDAERRAEIRIPGDGVEYCAPALVHHYVVTHEYRPPDEFVEAVMSAPLPGSLAYVRRYEWPLRMPGTHPWWLFWRRP